MSIEELLFALGGISLSVIGYFLKTALNEIKEVKNMTIDNKQKLAVLEIDYVNKVAMLNDKIDDLQATIKELTIELKQWNKNNVR
jgi:hypothetical protein